MTHARRGPDGEDVRALENHTTQDVHDEITAPVRLAEDGAQLLTEARRRVIAVVTAMSAEMIDGSLDVGVGMALIAQLERADRMIGASFVGVAQ
jgi:hypothetical protein